MLPFCMIIRKRDHKIILKLTCRCHHLTDMLVEFNQSLVLLTLFKCLNVPYLSMFYKFLHELLRTRCKVRPPSRWARARESIFTKFDISSPDSFTSRMKLVVTPVVQVSSRLGIYSTASHFTYISQSYKIAIPVASISTPYKYNR